jgi:hypothetical protein
MGLPPPVLTLAPALTSTFRAGGGGQVQLVRQVVTTLQDLDKDPAVRCIVLTGSDRAFAGINTPHYPPSRPPNSFEGPELGFCLRVHTC